MSSGAYQSKLFNFLSRQLLRVQQQARQTWRWSKVAAVWSVQIALYPVYVAFQSTRLVGKQLQQTSQRTRLRLRAARQSVRDAPQPTPPLPLSADTPIRHTLQAIESLQLLGEPPTEQLAEPALMAAVQSNGVPPALAAARNVGPQVSHSSPMMQERAAVAVTSSASMTASAARAQIQGVASLLTTRGLVLVTSGNGILNILTPEQQSALARRIVGELAIYWRERRLAGYSALGRLASPFVSRFLPLPHDRPNALPPIRSLWQTMGWMQRGAVAISVNLFQEAKLVWYRSALPALPDRPTLKSAQPWVEMEAQFYEALSRASQRTGLWLLQTLRAGTRTLTPLAPASPKATPHPPAAMRLTPSPGWIQQLDRWLSRLPGLQVEPSAARSQPDPWLTMEDLFGPVEVLTSEEDALSPNAAYGPTADLTPDLSAAGISPTASWEVVDTAVLETLTKIQAKRTSGIPAAPPQGKAPNRLSASRLLDPPRSMTTPPIREPIEPIERIPTAVDRIAAAAAPDTPDTDLLPTSWIDTKAELVAYEKHPLEQLLEWLDRGLVWIEERVAQVWRWLRQQFG